MYRIYHAEASASEAERRLFYNRIKEIADSHGGSIIVDAQTQEERNFPELSFEEVVALPVFGKCQGLTNYQSGYTTAVTNYYKIKDEEKWCLDLEPLWPWYLDNLPAPDEIYDNKPEAEGSE